MAKKKVKLERYGQWSDVAHQRNTIDAKVRMHQRPASYRLHPDVEQHAGFLRERARKRNKMNMGQKAGFSKHPFKEQKTNPALNK